MGTLALHDDVRELGIVNPVACLITAVHVQADNALDAEIRALLESLQKGGGAILERPEVRGFDELVARMGYGTEAVPAGRHRIELFRQRGFPRHNNLVDACNIATAEFGASLSLHDASKLDPPNVYVFRAPTTMWIRPLFKGHKEIPEGDIVSATEPCGSELLSSVGRWDVDSEDFKVTIRSTSVLLVVLGNAATSQAYNRAVSNRVIELIRRTCPDAAADFLTVTRHASPVSSTLSVAPSKGMVERSGAPVAVAQ